jgi:hypothetical protein
MGQLTPSLWGLCVPMELNFRALRHLLGLGEVPGRGVLVGEHVIPGDGVPAVPAGRYGQDYQQDHHNKDDCGNGHRNCPPCLCLQNGYPRPKARNLIVIILLFKLIVNICFRACGGKRGV